MSQDLADTAAIDTSREVARLVGQAKLSVEQARAHGAPSSTRAAALLQSLSLHLDELNSIAAGGIEQQNHLSALVVRHSHIGGR